MNPSIRRQSNNTTYIILILHNESFYYFKELDFVFLLYLWECRTSACNRVFLHFYVLLFMSVKSFSLRYSSPWPGHQAGTEPPPISPSESLYRVGLRSSLGMQTSVSESPVNSSLVGSHTGCTHTHVQHTHRWICLRTSQIYSWLFWSSLVYDIMLWYILIYRILLKSYTCQAFQ